MPKLFVFIMAAALVVSACGNGDRGASPTFVFRPEPYVTVTEATGTTVPYAFPTDTTSESCYPYPADEVLALVSHDAVAQFEDWLRSVGFHIVSHYELTGENAPTSVLVGVPVGAVPDAIRAISARPGVMGANTNAAQRRPELPNASICPPGP